MILLDVAVGSTQIVLMQTPHSICVDYEPFLERSFDGQVLCLVWSIQKTRISLACLACLVQAKRYGCCAVIVGIRVCSGFTLVSVNLPEKPSKAK